MALLNDHPLSCNTNLSDRKLIWVIQKKKAAFSGDTLAESYRIELYRTIPAAFERFTVQFTHIQIAPKERTW